MMFKGLRSEIHKSVPTFHESKGKAQAVSDRSEMPDTYTDRFPEGKNSKYQKSPMPQSELDREKIARLARKVSDDNEYL